MDIDLPVFIKPLEVEINGVGQYQHAGTVQDLTAMLLTNTPGQSRISRPCS
ncbi:hypothetical protein J2W42_003018 [Rhizobium tibeticum]|uniref:hypothetical protein n=1 Tax=Rhizobium tibeticum TaxID=501024 RepID=UPI002782A97D|nr:hypothetical protein [Rhizobium tibeticum]MDP9810157.1 hypothetical protein [Rhizobium tibeticum]